MDTRDKIVDPSGLRRDGRPLKLIIGYFDPLHAAHVRRMRQLCTPGEQIVVAIANPPSPLLSSRARAELVAGLAWVNYVVLFDEQTVRALSPQTVADERQADDERTSDLLKHVSERHRPK